MVKTQKRIEFVNDCDAIVDYVELEKAIVWYAKTPVNSIKHIYIHGDYPAISICKEKIHISDLVIYDKPKELSEFYSAHKFKDCHRGVQKYDCDYCFDCGLTRPPQSWCYVEENTNE